MRKINSEFVKNLIATVIAFSTLVILASAIISGIIKQKSEDEVLESGNIQNAIETGQY